MNSVHPLHLNYPDTPELNLVDITRPSSIEQLKVELLREVQLFKRSEKCCATAMLVISALSALLIYQGVVNSQDNQIAMGIIMPIFTICLISPALYICRKEVKWINKSLEGLRFFEESQGFRTWLLTNAPRRFLHPTRLVIGHNLFLQSTTAPPSIV